MSRKQNSMAGDLICSASLDLPKEQPSLNQSASLSPIMKDWRMTSWLESFVENVTPLSGRREDALLSWEIANSVLIFRN